MKSSCLGILIIIGLAILAIGLAIISPQFFQERVVKVTAENKKTNTTFIAARGVVESEEEIEVSNRVMGLISEVRVSEGDRVKRGQLLVILDTMKIMARIKLSEAKHKEAVARLREFEAGYRDEDIEMAQSRMKRAEIIYEKAKDEYQRQARLYQKEAATFVDLEKAEERLYVVTEELKESRANCKKFRRGAREEEIDQARAAVEKAVSDLHYYQAVLKDYSILSPIDGLIAERYRDPGETVDIGTPVLKLINPNKLRIRAELEETDVGKVVKGQSVEVSTDAYREKVYQGKVSKVCSVLKRYSLRTFDPSATYDINAQDIYAKLEDSSGLKNGMMVTVRFLK